MRALLFCGVEDRHGVGRELRERVRPARGVAAARSTVVERDHAESLGEHGNRAPPAGRRHPEAHDQQDGLALARDLVVETCVLRRCQQRL